MIVQTDLAVWGTVVGIVSAILGAVGAGVGVYVSMRLEIASLRASLHTETATIKADLQAFRTIVQARVDDLSADLKAISDFARQNTRPGGLVG
jgi:hypothetical protein